MDGFDDKPAAKAQNNDVSSADNQILQTLQDFASIAK